MFYPLISILVSDEIFNSTSPAYENIIMREHGTGAENRRQREKDREDRKLQVCPISFNAFSFSF